MENTGMKSPDRRKFLIAAQVAAGLMLADGAAFSLPNVTAHTMTPSDSDPFTLFPASRINDELKSLAANPGGKIIYHDLNVSISLGVEKAASAQEFEWHELRDHVFYILDGKTVYELGGTPKSAHSLRPGEWLAPTSEGAKTISLSAGDILVVPRGTPHRRRTPERVTFMTVSPGMPRP
jgi:quercetin dioxygenase-like cupin family protein